MCYVPTNVRRQRFGATTVAFSRVSFPRIVGTEDGFIMNVLRFGVSGTQCVHVFAGCISQNSGCRTSMEFNSGGSADFHSTLFALGGLHDPSCDQLSHDYTALLHELRRCQVVAHRKVDT